MVWGALLPFLRHEEVRILSPHAAWLSAVNAVLRADPGADPSG